MRVLLIVAVGAALAGGPHAGSSARNYRTGLLPQVLVAKRTAGKGCWTRAGGLAPPSRLGMHALREGFAGRRRCALGGAGPEGWPLA
jgi:hypothetical protein